MVKYDWRLWGREWDDLSISNVVNNMIIQSTLTIHLESPSDLKVDAFLSKSSS